MKQHQIELVPIREVVSRETALIFDLMIKIHPRENKITNARPPLNLGLVIDKSGSMQGQKLDYARQAAGFVVQQLLPSDMIGIVAYDHNVETLLPSTPAVNKNHILQKIKRIHSGGTTALHAGWVQGGIVVGQALQSDYLNRVILLSDGLANVGETNPDVIASDVHGLVERGISTTTVGVGKDYNEDLMVAMARSGDGNYWFIQSPEQLPTIFDQELKGLMATVGKAVTLTIQPAEHVELLEVYNDLDEIEPNILHLPNLITGNSLEVVMRLRIPPVAKQADICRVNLAWDDPESQARFDVQEVLTMTAVSDKELAHYPKNEMVERQAILLHAAQIKQKAIKLVDQGDIKQARKLLQKTREELLKSSDSSILMSEAETLFDLDRYLQARDVKLYRKMAHYQSHSRSTGRLHAGIYYRLCRGPIKGDITTPKMAWLSPIEAIVNSTDENLSAGGVLSRAIHKAAGPGLKAECTYIGHCRPGDAVITKAYNLPCQSVIHTTCIPWDSDHRQAELILRKCYLSCLQLAADRGIRELAFPAIGVGAMGFPLEIAAKIAMQTVGAFLAHDRRVEAVLFVCYDDATKRVYDHAFKHLTGRASQNA